MVYWLVSHVVNDAAIIYIVPPRVNLARQELYGVFAFLLLLPAVFGPQDRGLIRRFLQCWPMASLGVISYGIYLWHLNLIYEFLDWTGWHEGAVPFWLLALAVLAITVAFASTSYFGLERPILRIKGRINWWNRGAVLGARAGAGPGDGSGSTEPDAPLPTGPSDLECLGVEDGQDGR